MSANDPTDDELEREAARDVPIALGGTPRHAPKLSNESRAIDLRAVRGELDREREMRASREQHSMGTSVPEGLLSGIGGRISDRALGDYEYQPRHQAPAGRGVAFLPGTTAAERENARLDAIPLRRESAPSPREGLDLRADAVCWREFVVAALPLVGTTADAIAVADQLLAERRKRFP